MTTVGLDHETQENVYQLLGGLLALGTGNRNKGMDNHNKGMDNRKKRTCTSCSAVCWRLVCVRFGITLVRTLVVFSRLPRIRTLNICYMLTLIVYSYPYCDYPYHHRYYSYPYHICVPLS